MLARLGGEEFAVILPDADIDQACRLAERLRSAVAAHGIWHDGMEISCTVSLGVAATTFSGEFDPATQSPGAILDELLNQADKHLFFAKQAGRDRISA